MFEVRCLFSTSQTKNSVAQKNKQLKAICVRLIFSHHYMYTFIRKVANFATILYFTLPLSPPPPIALWFAEIQAILEKMFLKKIFSRAASKN